MNNVTRLLTIIAVIATIAMVGCSDQDVTSPTDTSQTDAVTQNAAGGLDRWAQMEAQLAEYGIDAPDADKTRRELPAPVLVAMFAAQATTAVNNGTTFAPLTVFRDECLGCDNAGFSVSWLEPIPGGNPGQYYCYIFVDRPARWDGDEVEVDPYTLPIAKAGTNQVGALADPDNNIISHSFRSDNYIVFDYVFTYNSPIGPRTAQLMKFRLAL